MVLPLLGSFLASSFLPAMTGLSPLMAGAIGSGLGSLAQGDDFDEALANGVFSFMGGKLLGGMQKPLMGTQAANAITKASPVIPRNSLSPEIRIPSLPIIEKALPALLSQLPTPEIECHQMIQHHMDVFYRAIVVRGHSDRNFHLILQCAASPAQ